jgi:hypothetical protein
MSTAVSATADQDQLQLLKFVLNFTEAEPTKEQKKIIRAIEENRNVLIVSGNGVGKSFAVALSKLAFLLTNPDSKVIGTSGSYAQYRDSVWNPMAEIFEELKESAGVPGKVRDHKNKLDIDRNWYAKVISPTDPGDLEGRHASRVMVVIEEADKKYITSEHFDSAYSSITDVGDRFVAIANPPDDQTGVVWDRLHDNDDWHVIQFSSFESHNVRRRRKEVEGLVTLDLIKEDYRNWNVGEWPGVDKAKQIADIVERNYDVEYQLDDEEKERLEGLDARWFKRRLGVIPPQSSSVHRPIYAEQVRDGYVELMDRGNHQPEAYGMDVAGSGGDRNVIFSFSGMGRQLYVQDVWTGMDHNANESRAREVFDEKPKAPIAIDAVGEGSGLADRLCDAYPNAFRFKSQHEASQKDKYKDRWSEGLNALGTALGNGTNYDDHRLREELLKATSVISFNEKYIKSRESNVYQADSKEKIKDVLGRSPDFLDGAYMSVWAHEFDHIEAPPSLAWGE